ncbi:PREDICTED: uncharacterized protein LOC102018052 [Chinchilla lanigera]|uniref:uncharacterized protein LOC102018052 n=1 Tax=Chinchilla lanigera TaxID=34839 RepID=UPI0006984BCC|nr:PREDICTED: uncharacterized protein LOC102018052 [Chinchilla lanigera]
MHFSSALSSLCRVRACRLPPSGGAGAQQLVPRDGKGPQAACSLRSFQGLCCSQPSGCGDLPFCDFSRIPREMEQRTRPPHRAGLVELQAVATERARCPLPRLHLTRFRLLTEQLQSLLTPELRCPSPQPRVAGRGEERGGLLPARLSPPSLCSLLCSPAQAFSAEEVTRAVPRSHHTPAFSCSVPSLTCPALTLPGLALLTSRKLSLRATLGHDCPSVAAHCSSSSCHRRATTAPPASSTLLQLPGS